MYRTIECEEVYPSPLHPLSLATLRRAAFSYPTSGSLSCATFVASRSSTSSRPSLIATCCNESRGHRQLIHRRIMCPAPGKTGVNVDRESLAPRRPRSRTGRRYRFCQVLGRHQALSRCYPPRCDMSTKLSEMDRRAVCTLISNFLEGSTRISTAKSSCAFGST